MTLAEMTDEDLIALATIQFTRSLNIEWLPIGPDTMGFVTLEDQNFKKFTFSVTSPTNAVNKVKAEENFLQGLRSRAGSLLDDRLVKNGCPLCGYKFQSSADVVKHMTTQHKDAF